MTFIASQKSNDAQTTASGNSSGNVYGDKKALPKEMDAIQEMPRISRSAGSFQGKDSLTLAGTYSALPGNFHDEWDSMPSNMAPASSNTEVTGPGESRSTDQMDIAEITNKALKFLDHAEKESANITSLLIILILANAGSQKAKLLEAIRSLNDVIAKISQIKRALQNEQSNTLTKEILQTVLEGVKSVLDLAQGAVSLFKMSGVFQQTQENHKALNRAERKNEIIKKTKEIDTLKQEKTDAESFRRNEETRKKDLRTASDKAQHDDNSRRTRLKDKEKEIDSKIRSWDIKIASIDKKIENLQVEKLTLEAADNKDKTSPSTLKDPEDTVENLKLKRSELDFQRQRIEITQPLATGSINLMKAIFSAIGIQYQNSATTAKIEVQNLEMDKATLENVNRVISEAVQQIKDFIAKIMPLLEAIMNANAANSKAISSRIA